MSNETDLDWLARNVHEWPVHVDAIHVGVGIKFGVMGWCVANIGFRNSSKITRHQWLARRAELQNKPSWDAVPNHANWFAQDAAGSWIWHSSEPECRNGAWIGSITRGYAAKGCVLGDWRDTLESRPEDLKPSIEEANMLAQEFKPFTSIEGDQEQEMKQDNGWFDRGELPPVGSQCEVMHRESWAVCDVIAHFQQKSAMVAAYTVDNRSAVKQLDSCIAEHFRPIRTEREVAIEDIKSILGMGGSFMDSAAAKLYDAGYRKESK